MFTPEEAQLIAEGVYQSWKWGDTSFDGNWFMVKLTDQEQELFQRRSQKEQENV